MQTKEINWSQLYESESPKLLGICRRYISERSIAEDIVHDSFVTAIQNSDQIRDMDSFPFWIRKIVVNNALQHIKKESNRAFLHTEFSQVDDTYSQNKVMDPDYAIAYDFTAAELLDCLQKLPVHHRTVFNLYFLEEYSHQKISALLGITLNTSKSHLLRAKKSLKKMLVQKTEHKNRNKGLLLLILLGFENYVWANTFRKSFSGFAVQPIKKLSKEFSDSRLIKPVKKSGSPETITILKTAGITLLIGAFILLLYNNSDYFFRHNDARHAKPENLSQRTSGPETLPAVNDADGNAGHAENISGEKKITSGKISAGNALTTTTAKNNRENSVANVNTAPKNEGQSLTDEAGAEEEVPSGINLQPLSVILADTAKNEVKKVVIIKKVTKRDTVFLPKQQK